MTNSLPTFALKYNYERLRIQVETKKVVTSGATDEFWAWGTSKGIRDAPRPFRFRNPMINWMSNTLFL